MKNLEQFQNSEIRYLFCDIDDTLTTHGQLPAESFSALWKLSEAGIKVIPITGRPAGWCDMIARFWPVDAVVGENGAFYFCYEDNKMIRKWAYDEQKRLKFQKQLMIIKEEVLKTVPGAAVSADQFCRLFDLAIDFCEDVPALDTKSIHKIVEIFQKHGAQAKISSIHVNGWFGDHDKLSMCQTLCEQKYNFKLSQNLKHCAFIGDSPNDEPMFSFFENSFAVANIKKFIDQLKHKPKYICPSEGAEGFVELANKLLN